MNIPSLVSVALVMVLATVSVDAANREKQEVATILASSPDVKRGEELFAACARCHGPAGEGVEAGTVPRIGGQHYEVLVRQLAAFRRGERWDFQMEGVATSHDVIPELQDIADVARYASELSPSGTSGAGNGQPLARGEKLYTTRCGSCHGSKGEGSAQQAIPRIGGQHSGYLLRQMYDAVDGRRPPLTRTHRERLASLAFEDVQALADYVSGMNWQPDLPDARPATR